MILRAGDLPGAAPLCQHGTRVVPDPAARGEPGRCTCCGNVPGSTYCGCAEAGECVHCGKFLLAGTWRAGDYGPSCERCLARPADRVDATERK